MITVFTSCYNQGEFLAIAIESVLTQTYKDFEYLLIDDGSTDNTWKIIQTYAAKDARIRPIKLPKQPNVGYVQNYSIREMKGDFWVWCPSDDILKPNCLERKLKKSEELNHSSILYAWGELINGAGKILHPITPKLSPKEFADIIFIKCPIGFTGIWIPKDIFQKVGLFPEHLNCCEDYYWLLKSVAHNIPYVGQHEVLYVKRIHPNRLGNRESSNVVSVATKIRKELLAYKDKINE